MKLYALVIGRKGQKKRDFVYDTDNEPRVFTVLRIAREVRRNLQKGYNKRLYVEPYIEE